MSCSVCGRSSTLRHAFVHGRDGMARRSWCPLCYARHRRRNHNITLACMTFILASAPITLGRVPTSPVTTFIVMFAAAYFASLLMVLPHELGHALAGRLVGFAPVSIVVGEGPLLIDRVILGVRLQIGRSLRGGATYLDVQEAARFKARMITALAAGPAVNVAAGIAAFAMLAWLDQPSRLLRTVLLGFGIGNLVSAAMSLWPRAARVPGGWTVSDGAQILGQIFDVPIDLRQRRATLHLTRAQLAYRDRDFETAKRETAAALALSDDVDLTSQIAALRAECFSEGGDPRSALDLLAPLLARQDLPETTRAHLDQAHAWAALLSDESLRVEDALAKITRCMELIPWSEVNLIKLICLQVAGAATKPERLVEARRGLEQLQGFRLEGESVGYAALARGLVAAAERNPGLARDEYQRAKNAHVSATSLGLLERKLANP